MTQGAQAFIKAVNRFVFQEDAPFHADAIFIPGSREDRHALKAAELYKAGYAPIIVPSGRFTKIVGHFEGLPPELAARYPEAYETEWAFLRAVLLQAGVPDAAILREDAATYTWDNAKQTRRVTDAAGLTVRRALLCCKPPHARRALLYYQAAFPHTVFRVCPPRIEGMMPDDWFLSEDGRALVLGEVQRCGGQIGEVFLDMLTSN